MRIGPDAGDESRLPYAFDERLDTSLPLSGTLELAVQPGTEQYTLLMGGLDAPVRIEQLSADGEVLERNETGNSFFRFAVAKGTATLRVTGDVEIFEVIAR